MIPGVIRGVIASSWLRASDQLRAPNSVTTGQAIPQVQAVSREWWSAEFRLDIYAIVIAQMFNFRVGSTMLTASQPNSPLRLGTSIVTVVRKVP